MIPSVSIIINVYNRARWLSIAIESALSQTHQPLEVVVVDDGSPTREPRGVVENFPEVRYFYKANQGLGAARNTGLENSRGEFIQFLDDDDWLAKLAISVKLGVFTEMPDVGVVYSDLYLTDATGRVTTRYYTGHRRPLPIGDIYPQLIERNFIPIHALLWRRTTLEQVGGFPIRSGHEDWECLLRAAEVARFGYVDQPLGYYRQHSQSMVHEFDGMYAGKLAFQDYLVGSERFSRLPVGQRARLLTRYAIQQFAYGNPQKARALLSAAHNAQPGSWLPYIMGGFWLLGRSVVRSLVRMRGWAWRQFRH